MPCVKVYKKSLLESMLKIEISKFGLRLREKLGQHFQKILRRIKWWRYWNLRSMFRIRNDMANKGYCRTKIETWKFKWEKGNTTFFEPNGDGLEAQIDVMTPKWAILWVKNEKLSTTNNGPLEWLFQTSMGQKKFEFSWYRSITWS